MGGRVGGEQVKITMSRESKDLLLYRSLPYTAILPSTIAVHSIALNIAAKDQRPERYIHHTSTNLH